VRGRSRECGDLAIANGKGVSIYRHAEGKPRTYKDRVLSNYHALGYDNDGNLLVTDGCGRGSSPSCQPAGFAYLPRRGTSLITISIPGPSSPSTYYLHVAAVLWDGKYWVIPAWAAACTLSPGCLTRISIKDSKATYAGTTNLDDFYYPGAVAIYNNDPKEQGTEIAGPPGLASDTVYFWNYPRGRKPIGSITEGVDNAQHATISYKTAK
jgi:hypothetical protein